MNRDQLIRELRRYANTNGLEFELDKKRGNGSHYQVRVGSERTIIAHEIDPFRRMKILKQLKIDPTNL